MRRRRRHPDDPFRELGLAPSATADDIDAARRALAKTAHPDIGGSLTEMQRINAAADEAMRRVIGVPPVPLAAHRPAPPPPRAPEPQRQRFGRRDHPSFTIEALPVEAFEGLVIVGGWLGDVIDDDPPYGLEAALGAPLSCWCRLDVVPDAGACTVSMTLASEPGGTVPDVDAVRDAWIAGLNQLDWADLDGSPSPP